jgi:hypothetical protein
MMLRSISVRTEYSRITGRSFAPGEFQVKCTLAEAAYVKDVQLKIDREGAMWLF